MYHFFDLETNGLPKHYKAPMTQLDNWPRVIQLAWLTYSAEGEQLTQGNYLIRPNGWTIPKEKFWIENNFSTETNEKYGAGFMSVAATFIADLQPCEHLIAHNINFDYPILGAEFLRYGLCSKRKAKRFCTMQSTTSFCALPQKGRRLRHKWPKLEELYHKLFAKPLVNTHDALADVTATAECFFELKNRGIITL